MPTNTSKSSPITPVANNPLVSIIANKGMTILELLISMAVVVILLGIAVPSFTSIIQNNRIKSASMELTRTLAISRNHAITSGTTVIVCQAEDSSMETCSEQREANTNWQNGIISYADINANNELDSQDYVITVMQNTGKIAVVFNQRGRLRFFNDGSARSAGFYICNTVSHHQRHLRILYTGRVRTSDKIAEEQYQTCLNNAV